MSTTSSLTGSNLTVIVSQQALNVLRQIVSAVGWPKAPHLIQDIYTGGKLLAETFPVLDSIDWIKTEEEIKTMTKEEQTSFFARDKEWSEKQVSFSISPHERDTIERAFQYYVTSAASISKLGPNPFLFELIIAFGIKDELPQEISKQKG